MNDEKRRSDSNVLDLDKLKGFRFKKPKGRPTKKLPRYPEELTITFEYLDNGQIFRSFTVHADNGPYKVNAMQSDYKKFLIEVCMKLVADISMDDPAMIHELEDWLKHSFNISDDHEER